MISAAAGYDSSLTAIRNCYLDDGNATKDEFERGLRAHKEATDQMRSVQREAAEVALIFSKDGFGLLLFLCMKKHIDLCVIIPVGVAK